MSEGKFTKSQLIELGFHQTDEGIWSKRNIPANDTKPQTAELERDECSSPLAKEKDQGPRKESFRFRLVVHSYRTRLIDASNASIKQIEDCLTPAQGRKTYGIGIFPDDSPEYCDQPLFLQTKVKKGEEKTEIEVYRYEVEK